MGEIFGHTAKMKLPTIHFNKGTHARGEGGFGHYIEIKMKKKDAVPGPTARGESNVRLKVFSASSADSPQTLHPRAPKFSTRHAL